VKYHDPAVGFLPRDGRTTGVPDNKSADASVPVMIVKGWRRSRADSGVRPAELVPNRR